MANDQKKWSQAACDHCDQILDQQAYIAHQPTGGQFTAPTITLATANTYAAAWRCGFARRTYRPLLRADLPALGHRYRAAVEAWRQCKIPTQTLAPWLVLAAELKRLRLHQTEADHLTVRMPQPQVFA